MKGIEFIKDETGRVIEIRITVEDQPTLAESIIRMAGAEKSDEKDGKSVVKRERMSLTKFRKALKEAKNSETLTAEEFLNAHPEWKKKEQLS